MWVVLVCIPELAGSLRIVVGDESSWSNGFGFWVFIACIFFFFFSSRRRHTRSTRDWSSDVCSSDLFQQEAKTAALALDPVDGDDVGVVEPGGGLRLLLKAPHHLLVLRDVGRQHFDRHLALEREVVRQEHRAHPTLPQQPLDPVLALDDALQPLANDVDAAGAGGPVPARDVRAARRAELAALGDRRVAAEAFEHAVGHRRWLGTRGARAPAADARGRRSAALPLAGGDGQVGVLQVPGCSSGTVPTQTS